MRNSRFSEERILYIYILYCDIWTAVAYIDSDIQIALQFIIRYLTLFLIVIRHIPPSKQFVHYFYWYNFRAHQHMGKNYHSFSDHV